MHKKLCCSYWLLLLRCSSVSLFFRRPIHFWSLFVRLQNVFNEKCIWRKKKTHFVITRRRRRARHYWAPFFPIKNKTRTRIARNTFETEKPPENLINLICFWFVQRLGCDAFVNFRHNCDIVALPLLLSSFLPVSLILLLAQVENEPRTWYITNPVKSPRRML